MDESLPEDQRGIERNWEITLKKEQKIKIRGGGNNAPGQTHPGLNELIDDFRRYQEVGGSIPLPTCPRRYVAWVADKDNTNGGGTNLGFI